MRSEPERPRGRASDWDAALFVWVAWTAALLAALRLSYSGRKYPFTDDWSLVPYLTGEWPVTLSWLWAQWGAHRIPAVKLVFLSLYNGLTGYDFRNGVIFNVVALAALAAAMILTARRLRGRTAYSDAFFPLALLQWGLTAIWWSFSVHYVSWMIVTTSFLLIIIRCEGQVNVRCALLGSVCLLLLPMLGTIGVVLVPSLAAWLLLLSALEWRTENGNRRGAVLAALGGAGSLGLALAYLVGLNLDSGYRAADLTAALRYAVKFLSAAFVHAFSGFRRAPWQLIMPCLILASLGGLYRVMRTGGSERRRGIGLLLFLAAMGSLALAVGVGRGAREWEAGVLDHYGILAAPLLIWVYFIWSLYYGSQPVGRFVQMSLLVMMCVVYTLNVGVEPFQMRIQYAQQRFEEDVRAGMPAELLAERHRELFWWHVNIEEGKAQVAEGMKMLRKAGAAPFRSIRED